MAILTNKVFIMKVKMQLRMNKPRDAKECTQN